MSQYRTGTVAVTNASAAVVGTGTAWLANVAAGDVFTVSGSGVPYVVGAVTDDTHLTLSSAYAGATASGQTYSITTSYTPNLQLAYPEQGDVDTATLLKRSMLVLDTKLAGLGSIPANRVPYADASGNLTSSASFTYNGSALNIGTGALTAGNGTFSGRILRGADQSVGQLEMVVASDSSAIYVKSTGADSNAGVRYANDARAYITYVSGADDSFNIYDQTGGVNILKALSGAVSVTGTLSATGNLSLTGASAVACLGSASTVGYVGNSSGAAYLALYGPSHATLANQIEMLAPGNLYTFKGSGGATLATLGNTALNIDSTTNATSGTTGSIQTDGGGGFAEDLYVAGNLITLRRDQNADTQLKIENRTNNTAALARVDVAGGQAASTRALSLFNYAPSATGTIAGESVANTSVVSDNTTSSAGLLVGTTGTGAPVKIFAGGATRLSVQSGGNTIVYNRLGVGNSALSPGAAIHSSQGATDHAYFDYYGSGAPFVVLRHARGTYASPTASQNTDYQRVDFRFHDGAAFLNTAWVKAIVSNTTGTNDMPTDLYFGVTADGAAAAVVQSQLSGAGAWRWNAYGAGTLTTDASGNITAVSDELLKSDIRPFARGLAELERLVADGGVIAHRWAPESGLDQAGTYVGFSAQKVRALIPEAVGRMNVSRVRIGDTVLPGHLTLNDRALTAAAVNAIVELAARLRVLEARAGVH